MILYLSGIFVREPNNNGINSSALARNIENIAHFSSKHFQSRSLNYAYNHSHSLVWYCVVHQKYAHSFFLKMVSHL